MTTIPMSIKLKAGELVAVRSKEEILSTLDQNGCLDGLPFMPEMFEFCGRQMRVYKRAHKTCDTINNTGARRVTNTVHLEGSRCDGQAHGGCQAECLLFWKEAWLGRVSATPANGGVVGSSSVGSPSVPIGKAAGCSECNLVACTRKAAPDNPAEPVYVCQATEMLRASTPLRASDWRQYWEDYSSGNFGLKWMAGVFFYANYTNLMARGRRFGLPNVLRKLYNVVQGLRGRLPHPRARGKIPLGSRTPAISLNLQPGELVRVKKFEEILETIDWDYYNRGLRWDAEMAPYCGGVYRVRKRVKQIIDEKNGKMLHLKSEPIMLEGAVCLSKYSNCRYFCPRSIYSYWREIWLERVEEKGPGTESAKVAQSIRS